MDTNAEAELRLKVAGLAAAVTDLDLRVAVLTTEVGKLLGELRALRQDGRVSTARRS